MNTALVITGEVRKEDEWPSFDVILTWPPNFDDCNISLAMQSPFDDLNVTKS